MESNLTKHQTLARGLGLKETLSLVVGTVIGTGVFLKAAVMSQQVGSPIWVLAAWVVAGALSLAGAFCYAELGCLFPHAGGEYVYLRKSYGDLPAFLYGWMRFCIGSPGSIAAYGIGAATFLKGVLGPGLHESTTSIALGFILFFTILNCFSVSTGGRVQAFITFLKVAMLLGLVVSIFTFGSSTGTWANLTNGVTGEWQGWSAFGTAMLAALWAYDGWNNMPMAAGEVKNPERNIPRALVLGMLAVLGIYALVNLAYFYALPFSEILSAYSKTNPTAPPVATKAASLVLGDSAAFALSIAFVVSALGAMNGSILTGARVPYAMACDGLFFKGLGSVNEKSKAPIAAVIVQGVIAMLLALSGTFDQLTDYVVFSAWIFYALVALSVIRFRQMLPNTERSFRVSPYPILPLVFITVSLLLLVNTLVTSPRESGMGLFFIALGVPVYLWFQRKPKGSLS